MSTGVIPERVQASMTALSIDQSELARRVGCTPAAINQILTGRTQRSRYLPAIATELQVALRFLTGDTDDPAGNAFDDALSSEEHELLELLRVLAPKDRAAIMQLARSLASCAPAPPPTLHSPRQDFKRTGTD